MTITGNIHILEKMRISSPSTLSSFLISAHGAICSECGSIAATAGVISGRNEIIAVKSPLYPADELEKLLKFEEKSGYRKRIIDLEGPAPVSPVNPEVTELPVMSGIDRIGTYYLIADRVQSDITGGRYGRELSEIISLGISPYINDGNSEAAECIELKKELNEGAGDPAVMKAALIRILELSGGQVSAYYSGGSARKIDIMLEGRELTGLVQDISERTVKAYGHYVNEPSPDGEYREAVHYRSGGRDIRYLIGSVSIESYFLVPVVSDSRVQGVLFVGSTVEDGFSQGQISKLRQLAGYEGGRVQIVYRESGEEKAAGRLLEAIPFGAALIGDDGGIINCNGSFGEYLGTGSCIFDTVEDLSQGAGYDFRDYLTEMRLFNRDINGRILERSGRAGSPLRVYISRIHSRRGNYKYLLLIEPAEVPGTESERDRIAVIAHEIRTPLSALRNSLSILAEEYGGEGLDENRTAGRSGIFRTAVRTAKRLGFILEGLDVRSRSIIPASSLDMELTGTRRLLESASEIYSSQIGNRGIEFDIRIEEGAERIYTDIGRFTQILQNLLSNSLKCSPGKIEILVSLRRPPAASVLSAVPWEWITEPEMFKISVIDNGTGFPPAVADYVNELSEQQLNPGFGLGLYISSGMAKSLGGILLAENEDGGGAACHIYLPRNEKGVESVRAVHQAGITLEMMKRRGKVPIAYIVVKEARGCWLDLSQDWRETPAINPAPGKDYGGDFYFWPLSSRAGIGLAGGGGYLEKPEWLFAPVNDRPGCLKLDRFNRFEIGWSICEGENCSIKSLLNKATAKLRARGRAGVKKGLLL